MKKIPEDFKGKSLDELLSLLPVDVIGHSRRVAVCCSVMTDRDKDLMDLYTFYRPNELAVAAHFGGLCHDVGKILVPAPPEGENYPLHSDYGVRILTHDAADHYDSEAQRQMVLDMVRYHHERPDGSGFPDRLTRQSIPYSAAICAIADSVDNIIFADGAQKKSPAALLDYVMSQAGVQFTNIAVDCFERALPRISELYEKWMQ